jgi:hypothetical protein
MKKLPWFCNCNVAVAETVATFVSVLVMGNSKTPFFLRFPIQYKSMANTTSPTPMSNNQQTVISWTTVCLSNMTKGVQ